MILLAQGNTFLFQTIDPVSKNELQFSRFSSWVCVIGEVVQLGHQAGKMEPAASEAFSGAAAAAEGQAELWHGIQAQLQRRVD